MLLWWRVHIDNSPFRFLHRCYSCFFSIDVYWTTLFEIYISTRKYNRPLCIQAKNEHVRRTVLSNIIKAVKLEKKWRNEDRMRTNGKIHPVLISDSYWLPMNQLIYSSVRIVQRKQHCSDVLLRIKSIRQKNNSTWYSSLSLQEKWSQT